LIDNGHKKILHFSGGPQSSHSQERIEGFKQAFSERTLAFNQEMIVPIGSGHQESYVNAKKYFNKLKKNNYPTAIVSFNDQQALAVMAVLKELNIRVPEDISIIGNDDISFADYFPIPLSTVRAPQYEIGRKAAEILIRNIEASNILTTEKVLLDTELVIRDSTRILS
jgi:LacI family transcriptional regulator/LacI family repressor for deo operon, udp, cdd, tsx, nupC, and nupG